MLQYINRRSLFDFLPFGYAGTGVQCLVSRVEFFEHGEPNRSRECEYVIYDNHSCPFFCVVVDFGVRTTHFLKRYQWITLFSSPGKRRMKRVGGQLSLEGSSFYRQRNGKFCFVRRINEIINSGHTGNRARKLYFHEMFLWLKLIIDRKFYSIFFATCQVNSPIVLGFKYLEIISHSFLFLKPKSNAKTFSPYTKGHQHTI